MIRRVQIQNFKSIGEAEVSLRPLNCLVGPNSSGKSNFLDALQFVKDCFVGGGVGPALTRRRGFDDILFYGAGNREFRITIEVDLPAAAPSPVSVQVRVGRGPPNYDELSFSRVEGSNNPVRTLQSNPTEWERFSRPFSTEVSRWRFHSFNPAQLRARGSASYQDNLANDGQNFPAYMHAMHSKHPKAFARIERELKKDFPELDELVVPLLPPEGSQWTEVGIREHGFTKSASGTQLSDGLVGFLAELAVIYGPDDPTLVGFEEPENYINPRLMERLVKMLRDSCEKTQVFLTTHSTSLLNHLHLDEVVTVSRDRKGTRLARPSDTSELKDRLADWALGDAYVSGVLGSAP